MQAMKQMKQEEEVAIPSFTGLIPNEAAQDQKTKGGEVVAIPSFTGLIPNAELHFRLYKDFKGRNPFFYRSDS